jgi:undecaprenyl-diphosphatase
MTTTTQPPVRSVFRSPRLLLLLAFLAVLTAAGLLGLDRLVAEIVRKQEPDWLHRLAAWISLSGGIGIYPFTALVVFCWAWWGRPNRGLRRACLWVLTVEAAGALLARALKIAFGRWRPDQVLGGHFEFFQLFKSKCHSFPSGHTADAAAVAAVLWFVYPRLRPLYVAWVVLMALARVGAEQHFVADAATGAALGLLCALAVGRNLDVMVRWVERRGGDRKSV